MNVACVSSAANDLGESPYWDVDAQRLFWIDAWRTQVWALDPATGETRCSELAIGARRPAHRLDRPSRSGRHDRRRQRRLSSPRSRARHGAPDRSGRGGSAGHEPAERRKMRPRRTVLVRLGQHRPSHAERRPVAARGGKRPRPDAGWPHRRQRHRLERRRPVDVPRRHVHQDGVALRLRPWLRCARQSAAFHLDRPYQRLRRRRDGRCGRLLLGGAVSWRRRRAVRSGRQAGAPCPPAGLQSHDVRVRRPRPRRPLRHLSQPFPRRGCSFGSSPWPGTSSPSRASACAAFPSQIGKVRA